MQQSWSERARGMIAPATGESPTLLASASGIIAIVALYLYFAGYVFSYFYYQTFGVTLESLDVSTQYYFVRSFTVFQSAAGVVLLCVVAGIAYGYAIRRIGRAVLLVTLIIAFPLVYHLSAHIGEREAQYKRNHPRAIVRFRFKGAEKTKPVDAASDSDSDSKNELLRLGDAEELHLLLETKDRVVVFYQPHNSFSAGTSALKVYTVLRSELDWSVVISG